MIKYFCDWLSSTSLSLRFSDAEWFVPTIQTIHILALSVVVSLLMMLNFRLLRVSRSGPSLQNLATDYIPAVWVSLLVLFVTGALLTIAEPARELLNNVFRVKMLLVAILIVMTLVLRTTLRKEPSYLTATSRRRFLGKALAVTTLVICIGIVAAGRLIAYT
jgi:hypothetical protein